MTSDVDVRANLGQLSAAWDPVDGAIGYEVAVADADGNGYLTDPAWTSAGNGTSATVAGLQLVAGARYVFAVRAILSQLNGRPSIARFTVLKSTTEKTCR